LGWDMRQTFGKGLQFPPFAADTPVKERKGRQGKRLTPRKRKQTSSRSTSQCPEGSHRNNWAARKKGRKGAREEGMKKEEGVEGHEPGALNDIRSSRSSFPRNHFRERRARSDPGKGARGSEAVGEKNGKGKRIAFLRKNRLNLYEKSYASHLVHGSYHVRTEEKPEREGRDEERGKIGEREERGRVSTSGEKILYKGSYHS